MAERFSLSPISLCCPIIMSKMHCKDKQGTKGVMLITRVEVIKSYSLELNYDLG